jgi:hypothetical protein
MTVTRSSGSGGGAGGAVHPLALRTPMLVAAAALVLAVALAWTATWPGRRPGAPAVRRGEGIGGKR